MIIVINYHFVRYVLRGLKYDLIHYKFDLRLIFFYQQNNNRGKMTQFFDSNMFVIEEKDGYVQPIHYRDLGEKIDDSELYGKKVTWADVTINGVPLEKTFEYEMSISDLEEKMDFADKEKWPHDEIVVNGRECHYEVPVEDDDYEIFQEKKWLNRLKKITVDPMNLPSAKRSKKKKNYEVKPKREEKKIQSEETISSFQEIVDPKKLGVVGENVFDVFRRDGKKETYCPPIHWIEPEIKWEKIWSAMDTIAHGYTRDYHYIPPGEIDADGVRGPAIYFYDKDSDDLNYNFNYYEDFIAAYDPKYIHSDSLSYWSSLSDNSDYERSLREYLEDPNEITHGNYMRTWWWSQAFFKPREWSKPWGIKMKDAPIPHL